MIKNDSHFVKDLLQLLIVNGAFNEQEGIKAERAFYETDRDQFDEFLLDEGLVERDVLLKALSQYYQVPSFDVDGFFFEHALLRQFPKDVLLRHEIIPCVVDENEFLVVVAAHPDDEELLSVIGEFVSYDVRFNVGIARDICDAVKEFYETSLTQDGLKETYSDDLSCEYKEPDIETFNEEEDEDYALQDEWD